jgi:hypothetical protein
MANPTTAKPAGPFTEKVNTVSTVGELMKCQVPLLANSSFYCPFLGVLAEPEMSRVGGGTGHAPILDSTGFTGGGLTDPCYKFGVGTLGLRVAGAGWTGTPTNPRTIWCVIKPLAGNRVFQRTNSVLFVGDEASIAYGIGLRISTAGVITLGSMVPAFTTSGLTLASGKWYLIALTYTSTTGRLWNVYNFTDQAYVSTQATGTSSTDGAAYSVALAVNHLVFNPRHLLDTINNDDGFTGSLYTFGSHTGTFDPAQNSYFAALVTDPMVAVRGALTGGGTLLSGGVTKFGEYIHCNRPTGGVQGSYAFELYGPGDSGFTPAAGTLIAPAQSSPVFSLPASTTNGFYKAGNYDGTSRVYSTTALAGKTQTPANSSKGDFFFGLAADSRYATSGVGAAISLMHHLRVKRFRCGVYNGAKGGTFVYSATASLSWQPNTTQDPVNGQASTTLLEDLLTACSQAGNVTHIAIALGINDILNSASAATTFAKLQIIVNYLVSQSYKVVLVDPYLSTSGTEAQTAALIAYWALLPTLANGTTILYPTTNYCKNLSFSGMEAMSTDYLHYNFSNLEGMAQGMDIVEGILDPPARHKYQPGR